MSPSPKDKMAHEVKDQQYYGTPKQQTDNRPVVRLALGFFHEAPKLYSWRQHRQCELHLSEFGSRRFYHRGTRTILPQKDKNHFVATTGGEILKRDHPDKSTLIVTDKYGKIVLNVHYINESAVKTTGTFVYPGTTISIDKHEGSIRGAATYIFHQDCWMEIGINSGSTGITLRHQ